MRLDQIWIETFKNLKDLTVDFDEQSPFTVLVGENGSGKSNLIEAITLIFRNLDLGLEAPFGYDVRYRCRGDHVRVRANSGKIPSFAIRKVDQADFSELPRKRFMESDREGRPLFRPSFVFGYYSGPTDRLAALYDRHQERFYSWIIKSPEQRGGATLADPNSLRRLFYAQTLHGQFALLAFFMRPETGPDDDRAFLREHLQIDSLDSVLFALRKPPWNRKGGDPRFWNAEGEVRDFLGRLYAAAMLPLRVESRIPVDLAKRPSIESLYLYLSSPEALQQVANSYRDQYAFFTALESTYLSKVLGEVRTRVRMTPEAGGGEITYRDLSEGEQQLLLVLGLLKFTAREEALFLLDEPDTHLNPLWSTQYLSFLDHFIRGRESCQVIMSTHDPLVFAGLTKSQVRVLRRVADGRVSAEEPMQDPRGLGVQAILTSDLFRLRSTLDPETQRDLDLQRELSNKPEELTPDERVKLEEVRNRLQSLGFWTTDRDPLFSLFLKKWTARERPECRNAIELTPEQIRAREELAAQIVAEISAEREPTE